ncbi:beta-amyrin 28-monooxygenase-like [Malania oleifera]|uniref:beta-amyrin 28-monooxygenase-like n=1 Tax=Malania oleifera TaxID=397392 RepID=UPI0025ADF7BA|nr:beta-amyrin 28-monooxygenase-like [Malania oleifera]
MVLLIACAAVLALLLLVFMYVNTKPRRCSNLPPGSTGWPLLGETSAFLQAHRKGRPESFVQERMDKHNSRIFRTSLLGENIAVLCGPPGNKFLFGNENKLVALWWPSPIRKLFGCSLISMVGDEAKRVRKMLMTFLGPEALARYITDMDNVTQHHFRTHWDGKRELKVYPAVKIYTFELACRLFASVEDPQDISRLAIQFNVFLKGLMEIPLKLPGTRFYRAGRAANNIREKLQTMIKLRRVALEQKRASPCQDLLSYMLVTPDENGRFLTEVEIIDDILTLLFAGHDTSASAITMLVKYLGELPQVYEKVFKEQIDIAMSKETGASLQWEDIQKMRYSWNVVSEVMRLTPPVSGNFREALVDFTYEGYTIPKGWKLYWSASSTHKDPSLFPSAENFNASRFEEAGGTPFSYVPFGGGPRMCLGKEYARLEILVFLHNLVKRFKWDLLILDEKIEYDPMATPEKGLPIHLQPHASKF